MENKNEILNQLKLRDKPAIPKGFFNYFITDLMQNIETEQGVLGQLKKAEKPSIPDGFFDQLTFIETDSNVLDQLTKSELPALPESYFEDFIVKIHNLIDNKSLAPTKGRIFPLKRIIRLGGIAAVFALLFIAVNFFSSPQEIIHIALEDTTETIYDEYLTYLDEGEIIEYLIENNISIEDTSTSVNYDTYEDFSEEDIEDYYLEELL